MSESDRFWDQVQKTDTCWNWRGGTVGGGYPLFTLRREGKQRNVVSHRFAYEELIGPIPEGLQLDHLCRNRICVNPAHLEPVTARENTLRGLTFQRENWLKTHCKRGHPFDEANTYIIKPSKRMPNGGRSCRACDREKMRRRRGAGLNVYSPRRPQGEGAV